MSNFVLDQHVVLTEEGYVPPPDWNVPFAHDRPPKGWFLFKGDGQRVCRVLIDMFTSRWGYASRTLNLLDPDPQKRLGITNATYPLWHWDGSKVREYKTVVRLDKRPVWKQVFEHFLGPFNWVWFCQPGIGWQDTNDQDTDPYSSSAELKFQSVDCANNIRKILPSHSGVPERYVRVETLDYNNPPVWDSTKNRWTVDGRELSYENSPHLLEVQTLVGHTKDALGNTTSYGPVADKGQPGGHGKVIFPLPMAYPAYHERRNVYEYPDTGFVARVFKESLIVNGVSRPQTGGIEVEIDAMCFTSFSVWGREKQAPGFLGSLPFIGKLFQPEEKWYFLETMVMRGNVDDWSQGGTYHDWLIFTDYGGNPPPTCPPQDIGWRRTKTGAEWYIT